MFRVTFCLRHLLVTKLGLLSIGICNFFREPFIGGDIFHSNVSNVSRMGSTNSTRPSFASPQKLHRCALARALDPGRASHRVEKRIIIPKSRPNFSLFDICESAVP